MSSVRVLTNELKHYRNTVDIVTWMICKMHSGKDKYVDAWMETLLIVVSDRNTRFVFHTRPWGYEVCKWLQAINKNLAYWDFHCS